MSHLVQYSTGTTSAEVARLVIDQHGAEAVTLVTADTLIEDDDNWRFATEAWEWLGRPAWVKLTDGRNPMQVGRDNRAVPNNRWAICSRVLKRELLRAWMDANYEPADSTVYLGFDWSEVDRWDDAQKWWPPFNVAAPLMAPGSPDKADVFGLWRSRGIEIPLLNREGSDHANCGGGCVRAGMSEWDRLRRIHPDRYAWWEAEEEVTRALLGKDVAILKDRRKTSTNPTGKGVPVTLRAFRERQEAGELVFGPEDTGACACDSYRPDEPAVAASSSYTVEWRTPDGWRSAVASGGATS